MSYSVRVAFVALVAKVASVEETRDRSDGVAVPVCEQKTNWRPLLLLPLKEQFQVQGPRF